MSQVNQHSSTESRTVFFAQDRDGDFLISPIADDVGDWAEDREGISIHTIDLD